MSEVATLLAVCEACEGAGSTALAYLIAWSAAERERGPVLVCQAGESAPALALHAGVESPRSLVGVATALAREEPLVGGLFAEAAPGLRVIARASEEPSEQAPEGNLSEVLKDAREVHALTVVDCGGLTTHSERLALSLATHVALVFPASATGIEQARRTLAGGRCETTAPALIVARRHPTELPQPVAALAELAAESSAPLVLLSGLPRPAGSPAHEAAESAALGLEAIWGFVRR